ncbi:helix-turn-helix domain-containing protein [Amycolatopsis sacchari]|uniref:Helix-turn-helix domain-containing protein n=1 Tax=Amycolatopsis sacchari TaxID=115433 RepID=A0A1I3M0D5_9PSEU|nr:helix-turn-helix transcriptional regulator [Amycolatopsis sacchari]SFI90387.1 Helix-turn-helix domain-containing protein [Amycolatopsis sacchari]
MTGAVPAFGARLRALRLAKGLSLSGFAGRVYYSKGYLSRVENGLQQPSAEFVRRCDAELAADGELVALTAPPAADPAPARTETGEDGLWMMTMTPDGENAFQPLARREVLRGGAAALAGLAAVPAAAPAFRLRDSLRHHEQLLAAARGLGQVAPPRSVLPMLVGQAQSLRAVARQAGGSAAVEVARVFARTAEFAGWMTQESGDTAAALWWTAKAAEVAASTGDRDAASYALVRQALITLYAGDAATTVDLARQAQVGEGTSRRVLGLAAQREAQGHALAGNHGECLRALDRAAGHLAAAKAERTGGPVVGTTHVPDPVAVVTGWCLHDLGRPREAAQVLDREIARIPENAVRARLRFGVRRALAHAAAGELEHACELAQGMIAQGAAIGSATVLADFRRFAATVRRWSAHPAVRALEPGLAALRYR